MTSATADASLLATCRARAIDLLKRNLSPAGVRAAAPGERAAQRRYTAIFGRDAAICALGMAVSGDAELERAAAAGLETLAMHQAPNGQLPKFVDVDGAEADFWYLGCIDSTLWWLIATEYLDRHSSTRGLLRRLRPRVERAIGWLLAQEHQRFFLLQQNEASDWADIMPRSGFVLYTNALWYRVKVLFGLPRADDTRASFESLFHPFSAVSPEDRRARLLSDYALKSATIRDLYLSFVNFSFVGDEGDVLGNLLAIVGGAADDARAEQTLEALLAAGVHEPYPVRSVVQPITRSSSLWRPYMARHRQNLAWQYHNGGIWPMLGAFWVTALMRLQRHDLASAELVKLARSCAVRGWQFPEWLHGRTFRPRGMPAQSWSAAGFLMADHVVHGGEDPLAVATRALPRGMKFA